MALFYRWRRKQSADETVCPAAFLQLVFSGGNLKKCTRGHEPYRARCGCSSALVLMGCANPLRLKKIRGVRFEKRLP
jgi:hypothetical protein